MRQWNVKFLSRFRRDNSGSVLILVVWTLAMLGFLAVGFGASSIFSIGLMDRMLSDVHSYAAARSALPVAQKMVEDDGTPESDGHDEPWINDPLLFQNREVGGGQYTVSYEVYPVRGGASETRYGFIDEERRLNINSADTDILNNVFLDLAKLEPGEALILAHRVMDWRDEDRDRRDGGAEDYEYRTLRPGYEAKDAPFESLEELMLVKGMTPEIYERIEPYLTVYGNGRLNLNTAGSKALKLLGLSDTAVTGILLYRAGADGEEGTGDDQVLPALETVLGELTGYIPQEDMNVMGKLFAKNLVGVGAEAFRLRSAGRGADAPHPVTIECVFNRNGDMLYWNES